MPCYHLIDAWQLETGKIVFAERGKVRRALRLPCGQCVGCRLERSRQWAVRCMHESSLHLQNCFVTLTYDDDHLPDYGSLFYRDFQLFMKRLRKRCGRARFYMAGEYGAVSFRPHFHACIFGVDFSDRVLFKSVASGFKLYTSAVLAELWSFGFSSVGDVSFESAAYVARYLMKKVTGPASDSYYSRVSLATGEIFSLTPEFCHMSLKPGIGRMWIERYLDEVVVHDGVVVRGRKCRVPKYYDKYLRMVAPFSADDVEYRRYLESLDFAGESSDARCAVREEVAVARLGFKKRSLEL